jgi:integrase
MRRLPYTDAEVAALLVLAEKEEVPRLRWIPWLLALTGARAGEIAQLWGAHVKHSDGIHFLSITPTDDGGEIKNAASEREVPLHPEIIKRGFLEFVATRNGGPLFYGGESASPRPPKPDAMSHAAKGPINRVREWVRKQKGFDNPRKAPNHSFRHWFKTACMKAGILDSVADAIQGHVGSGGEADTYRHSDLATMYAAICRLSLPN